MEKDKELDEELKPSLIIREIRKCLNLDRVTFAELIGVKYKTLWDYENDRTNPPGRVLVKIVSVLEQTRQKWYLENTKGTEE